MKIVKIILTVLFTLLLIASALVAEVTGLVKFALLQPSFYSKAMVSAGFYTPIYDVMTDSIKATCLNADLPEDLDDQLVDLIHEVMPRKDFNKEMGAFIGGAMDYLFYQGPDVVVPFAELAQQIKDNIVDSVILENTGLEDISDSLAKEMTSYLNNFVPSADNNMLSDYIEFYFANGNSQLAQRLTDMIYSQFYTYSMLLNYAFIGSVVLTVLLLGFLFLVWLKKPGTPVSILGILLDVSGGLHLLGAASLFVVFKLLNADFVYAMMPSMLPTTIVPSVISLIAFISLLIAIIGVILLAIGIALNFASNAMNKETVVVAEEKAAS